MLVRWDTDVGQEASAQSLSSRSHKHVSVVYLTYWDEKNSAHNGKNGSLEAAGEGHLGMAGFQMRDLWNIRHRLVSYLPRQSEHTRKHTVSGSHSGSSQRWCIPDPNILPGSDDPLQWSKNEAFKLPILSLKHKTGSIRGWVPPPGIMCPWAGLMRLAPQSLHHFNLTSS